MPNFVTDYGGVADGQTATAVLTISSGTKNLSSSTNLWASGDVGKVIRIGGAGAGGGTLASTIVTFTDAKHVVLADNAGTALSASSQRLCWGTNNADQSWNFNTANVGGNVVLTVPAGVYVFGSTGSHNGGNFGSGVSTLVVNASGATLAGGIEFAAGSAGLAIGDASKMSFVNTVVAGAKQAVLKTPAEISRFSNGQKLMLGSLATQGTGWPPNLNYYDMPLTVQTASGATVTFAESAQFTHRDSYPDMGGVLGGPAALYILGAGWDVDFTLNSAAFFTDTGQGMNANGRRVRFVSCTSDNSAPFPSSVGWFEFNGCNFPNAGIEVDKLINDYVLTNTTLNASQCQSSAPLRAAITGCTFNNRLQAAGRNAKTSGNVFNALTIGISGYGRCDTWESTNDNFTSLAYGGAPGSGDVTTTYGALLPGGIISLPLNQLNTGFDQFKWAVPGTVLFFTSLSENEGVPIIVSGVWSDGVNGYVQFSGITSWPTYLPLSAGQLFLQVLPAERVTFTGATGCADALDLSGAPAGGRLYEYSNRTYTVSDWGTGAPGQLPQMQHWGNVVSATWNVTKAYTGAQAQCLLSSLGRGGPFLINADGSTTRWPCTIDMKVPGSRTASFGSSTTQGGGDSVPVITQGWMQSQFGPYLETDISGDATGTWPIVTITLRTKQINQYRAAPLALRLHA